MNLSLLTQQRSIILLLASLFFTIISISLYLGDAKPVAQIDWLDVLGEGSINLIILVWIFFTLISRPAGKVTNLLVAGLSIMCISMLLDFLDEFVHYSQDHLWITTIESLPAPVGMVMMTFALYHWHREQLTLNNQLIKRERFYRQYQLTDYVTGLNNADYMRGQIAIEIERVKKSQQTFSLILLDISKFDHFNRHYGLHQGDKLLRGFGELILMNIRPSDISCRFASDRFIILLPDTQQDSALAIASQIQLSIAHLAHKPDKSSTAIYHQIHASVCQYQTGNDCTQLFNQLHRQMEQEKLAMQQLPAA